MSNTVKFNIITLSNLFIGGAPVSFEIGGIDQQTILDSEGFPYIPGSSQKGALRAMARQDKSLAAEEIKKLYASYLKKQREDHAKRIQEIVKEQEALDRIEKNYTEAEKELSAEYLFGIKGFNNSPKLLFSDALLGKECRHKESCFSIDIKNSIDDKNGIAPISNPRTYRTARSGLVFEGEIRLYQMDCWDKARIELCREYVIKLLQKFNEGIYRLGNSKSRGYGKVEVRIAEEMTV